MALLSRSQQTEVDQAKDGIIEIEEAIRNLDGYVNGVFLYLHTQRYQDLANQAQQHQNWAVHLITKYFGEGSVEVELLSERIKNITNEVRGRNDEETKHAIERNVSKAQDAMADAVELLKERIESIRNPASKHDPVQSTKKDELFTLKPTIWGMSVDLKAIWRRIRGLKQS